MVFALSPAVLNPFLYRVLQNIIELKPRSKYILAVDDSKNTLEEVAKVRSGPARCISFKNRKVRKRLLAILQVISETLGSGKLRKVPEVEATSMAAFQVNFTIMYYY